MNRVVRRRTSLLVFALLMLGLIPLSTANPARAIKIDPDSSPNRGTVTWTDTANSPAVTCTYDLKKGKLSVSIVRPSRISSDNYAESSFWRSGTITLTTNLQQAGKSAQADPFLRLQRTLTKTMSKGPSSVSIGGTYEFSSLQWGLDRSGPGTAPSSIGPLWVDGYVEWDSNNGSNILFYTVVNHRTTVIWPDGSKTSTVGNRCTPPYQPVVKLNSTKPAAGSTQGFNLSNFPASTRVTYRYQRLSLAEPGGSWTIAEDTYLGGITTDASGKASGKYKTPTPRLTGKSYSEVERLVFRIIGTFEAHVGFEPHEILKREPSSGVRNSSVTFTLVGCPLVVGTNGAANVGKVFWNRDGAWQLVASIPIGSSNRGSLTVNVPSWAPIGRNGLQFTCKYSNVFWNSSFTVVATVSTAEVSPEPTETPTPMASATVESTPTEATSPEVTVTLEPTQTPSLDPSSEPTEEPTAEPAPTDTPMAEPAVTEAPVDASPTV